MNKAFLYGKDELDGVTSIEVKDGQVHIFKELNGSTWTVKRDATYWLLFDRQYDSRMCRLKGNLHYKYYMTFKTESEYRAFMGYSKGQGWDYFCAYNPKEAYMLRSGVTYFNGMKPKDVSTLSFDIETTGITHDKDSKVLMISNTYRQGDKIERNLFSIDDYKDDKEMIHAWCAWVRRVDPSIILGHNIYGFDIPYLIFRAGSLPIGRDGSKARRSTRVSLFRKDGSQSYDFQNVLVFGRELVDTWFLSLKYDIGRNYDSYGLKAVVRHEGLEREERQHYDAATIAQNYTDELEFEKIKKYAEHDADDALALFDLMIPSFFYYNQSIPKPLQQIINSATGSQLNSFLVRSYLQEKHSIPKASERIDYEGAISFGIPGVYNNVFSVDFHAMYPSIIRQYQIEDKDKDPLGYLLRMTDSFANLRVEYKNKFKETGDKKYDAMQSSAKTVASSIYGLLNAPGLNFNSPHNASKITRIGRELLDMVCVETTSKKLSEWRPQ